MDIFTHALKYIELYCSLCMLSQNPDTKHAGNMP